MGRVANPASAVVEGGDAGAVVGGDVVVVFVETTVVDAEVGGVVVVGMVERGVVDVTVAALFFSLPHAATALAMTRTRRARRLAWRLLPRSGG
jgi:hypothetical protein